MEAVKIVLKFKNGEQIAIPVAEHSSGFWDVLVYLRGIEENDSPIEVVVLENGKIYKSSGKELLSVELKFK